MAMNVDYSIDRAMQLLYRPVLKSTSGRMGGVTIVIVKEVCTPEPRQF